jgi:hypothetical protein
VTGGPRHDGWPNVAIMAKLNGTTVDGVIESSVDGAAEFGTDKTA